MDELSHLRGLVNKLSGQRNEALNALASLQVIYEHQAAENAELKVQIAAVETPAPKKAKAPAAT